MKQLNPKQVQDVSGGIWGVVFAIAASVIAAGVRHRKDKDLAKREGMDPNRRETVGF